MRQPDGTPIMHGKRPYDAGKAHEYYMRTRKLKGRKTPKTQEVNDLVKKLSGMTDAQILAEAKKNPAQKATMLALIKSRSRVRTKNSPSVKDLPELPRAHRSSGDSQARRKAETVKATKIARAAEQVKSIQQELTNLNQALKKKMASKTSSDETGLLKQKIDEAQSKLDEAVKKQQTLNNAT